MLDAPVNHALSGTPYPQSHMETMGDRIRTLRLSRRLSLDEMGKIVGISPQAIHQWETGTVKGIRPENFLRFCAYFAADPYWVVFGSDKENDPRSGAAGRVKRLGG